MTVDVDLFSFGYAGCINNHDMQSVRCYNIMFQFNVDRKQINGKERNVLTVLVSGCAGRQLSMTEMADM